jgi:hypothetical protein
VENFIDGISWEVAVIASLTLGLAPFRPPHIWEKIVMLSRGELKRPLDWFDFFLHGAPWAVLVLKIVYSL